MKLVPKIRLYLFSVLSLCLAAVALVFFSLSRAEWHLERMHLAHKSYETHLQLESHTYQLFKQFGDALLVAGAERVDNRGELVDVIRSDIAVIRETIAREIELVGEEEIEELAKLAEIEDKVEMLIRELQHMLRAAATDSLGTDWWELSSILENEIDTDFRELIDHALAEEVEELDETRADVAAHFGWYRALGTAFALIAIGCAMLIAWLLHKRVGGRLNRLLNGVRQVQSGDMQHRVQLDGRDELADIAASFDSLASRVDAESQALAGRNAELDAVVHDRTRQLEALLNDARDAETQRRRMLSDVSHELRTPLTIIQGEADIALRGEPKPVAEYRDALQRAREAASHTSRLVNDLLFIARTEEGMPRLRIARIDLVELARDVARATISGTPLETDLAEAPVNADADRVRQALMILLQNASHHGGRRITLHLARSTDGYRLSVEDDGVGMTDTEKAHAFERFFRGSNAAEQYRDGLGLGLPVAKSIVTAHGGEILLADRDGGGLIATLLLPRLPRLELVS